MREKGGVRFRVGSIPTAAAAANPLLRTFTRTPISDAHSFMPRNEGLPSAIAIHGKRGSSIGGFHGEVRQRRGNRVKTRGGKRPTSARQVSLPGKSPGLYNIWEETESALKTPSKDDNAFLDSVFDDNLSGCMQFIKSCFDIHYHDGLGIQDVSLQPRPHCRLGLEIIRGAVCPPPVVVTEALHECHGCGKTPGKGAGSGYPVNGIAKLISERGGHDEVLWEELQRLGVEGESAWGKHQISGSKESIQGKIDEYRESIEPPSLLQVETFFAGIEAESKEDTCRKAEPPALAIGNRERRPRKRKSDSSPADFAIPAISVNAAADRTSTEKESAAQLLQATRPGFECQTQQDILNGWSRVHKYLLELESKGIHSGGLTNALQIFGGKILPCAGEDGSPTQKKLTRQDSRGIGRFGDGDFSPCGYYGVGPRGRHYAEVWEEELFLNRMSVVAGQDSRFSLLHRWDTILPQYRDNHDGCYREFMISQTTPMWEKEKERMHRSRETRPDLQFEEKKQHTGEVELVPPPVPWSMHHPAAWGLHCRDLGSVEALLVETGKSHCSLSQRCIYEYVHPAAFTACVVQPFRCFSERADSKPESFFPTKPLEDSDELSVYAESAARLLQATEAKNVVALARLVDRARRTTGLAVLRAFRESLEGAVLQYFKHSSETMEVLPLHPFRPIETTGEEGVELPRGSGDVSGKSSSSPEMPLQYPSSPGILPGNSNRALEMTLPEIDMTRNRIHLLGALPRHLVPHGEAVHSLKPGDIVEVRNPEDDKWLPGKVLRLAMDGNSILRSVKVEIMCSPLGEGHAVWCSVEDGLLLVSSS